MNLGLLNTFSLPDSRIQALQMTMDSTEKVFPSCPACKIFTIKYLQVTAFTTHISSSQLWQKCCVQQSHKTQVYSPGYCFPHPLLSPGSVHARSLWIWPPRATLAQTVHRSALGSCRRPLQAQVPAVPAGVLRLPLHAQLSVCHPSTPACSFCTFSK